MGVEADAVAVGGEDEEEVTWTSRTRVWKDPSLFDFLTLAVEASEREIENALVTHISRFLIELGAGFAYVGRQIHIEVDGRDFFIDLLFYHLRLRCYA